MENIVKNKAEMSRISKNRIIRMVIRIPGQTLLRMNISLKQAHRLIDDGYLIGNPDTSIHEKYLYINVEMNHELR